MADSTGGRAEQSARGSRDGVREQGFLQARHPAVLVQHLRGGRHAGQRAERVEEVVEEQREHHDQETAGKEEFPAGQVRALLRPFVRVQALAEERAELPERPADAAQVQRRIQRIHLRLRVHLIKPRRLAQHAESPREQDADQDRAFHPFVEQHDRHEESDQRERGADAVRGPGVAERHERGQARAVHDDPSPLEPDEHDEEPDAHADGGFQRQGDGVEDLFTDRDQRADQEYDALHEHRHHPELPRDPHADHHGEREERHDADARHQRERVLPEEPHQDRADERRDGGGDDRSARRKPDLAHHARIDGEDVDHGEEGGDSGDDFGLDGRAVFGKVEMKHLSVCPSGDEVCGARFQSDEKHAINIQRFSAFSNTAFPLPVPFEKPLFLGIKKANRTVLRSG